MKIISNNTELKKFLERTFKECLDIVFIDAVDVDDAYSVALEEAKDGKPVVVLGCELPVNIVNDLQVRMLMCKKNVGYIQIPFSSNEVKQLYSVLQRGKRLEEDCFAQELDKRYMEFNCRPDVSILRDLVLLFGNSRALNDTLMPPSQRYKCE